jgi:hypothetical protein
MTLSQHAYQMFFGNVSISLRSRYRCVTEKLLNDSYVNTVPQEQSCYGVSQHMWRDVAFYASVLAKLSDDVGDALSR